MAERPVVAVVGPLPPPLHGHMVVTRRILDSERLGREFELVHVDQSDHRGLSTLNRVDLVNVWLAVVHAARLVRTVVRRRPAIVHVPLAQDRLAVARDTVLLSIALLGGCKVVAHVHGGGFAAFLTAEPAWVSRPVGFVLRRCARLVTLSESQRRELADLLPGVSLSVVWHGTAPMPDLEREPGGPLRALFLSSNLIATKGLFTVLEAAERAEREGLPIRWRLVGTWSNQADHERAGSSLERLATVSVGDPVAPPDVAAELGAADVLVFPTTSVEGFGLVRIEAMAAGLPVITTEAGGGREIVRDGIDGFIIDYGASGALVDRVRRLHADPELRARMGESARKRQRSLFTEETFAESLAAAWRDTLNAAEQRSAAVVERST
ncbi:MAG: glycosyltransferase family 4 protein [Gaiellaceae bacterium]